MSLQNFFVLLTTASGISAQEAPHVGQCMLQLQPPGMIELTNELQEIHHSNLVLSKYLEEEDKAGKASMLEEDKAHQSQQAMHSHRSHMAERTRTSRGRGSRNSTNVSATPCEEGDGTLCGFFDGAYNTVTSEENRTIEIGIAIAAVLLCMSCCAFLGNRKKGNDEDSKLPLDDLDEVWFRKPNQKKKGAILS